MAGTLDWCNEVRVEQGKKPLKRLPKGRRKDPLSCPCGKVTGLHVGRCNAYEVLHDGHPAWHSPRRLPAAVRDFVYAFDKGRLPQYEAKRGLRKAPA